MTVGPARTPIDFRIVRDAWESIVALFSSGAGIWLATLTSTLIAGGFGIWYGRKLQREDARLDRLRDIYGRLMEVALRWTPPELQLRVPGGMAEPSPDEVDALTARLMIESVRDEDEVRQALVGVQHAVGIYRVDKNNAERGQDIPNDELKRNRQDVYDKLSKLQTLMRARLR